MDYKASAEQIFLEWNEAGWRVNNCFQLENGSWQVNVRSIDGESFSAFGIGKTIASAFRDLLDREKWREIPVLTSSDDWLEGL